MKYKGIIFDMDGVILNTNPIHFKVWKQIALMLGLGDYTLQDNEEQKGTGRRETIIKLATKANKVLTESEIDYFEELKNKMFFDIVNSMDKTELLFNDVKETLIILKQKGYKLAVGSSSKNAVKILTILNIDNLFDYMCDGSMVQNAKPNPEIFLKCVNGLKLNNDECIIVEDSISGIMAGQNAQIDTIGIESAKQNANYKINTFKEILNIL